MLADDEIGRTARILVTDLTLTQDLGQIVMRPSQVVARGRVIDELGNPVRGAYLYAGDGAEGETTGAACLLCTESDERGNFQTYGTVSPRAGQLNVMAEAPIGWLIATADFELGDEDIQLVIPSRGALLGSLALPEQGLAGQWLAEIRPDFDLGESEYVGEAITFSEDGLNGWPPRELTVAGRFGWRVLRAGSYSMRLR